MHFVERNINFNKNETKSKMKNPTHSFKGTNLLEKPFRGTCFYSYKNHKLKAKLWWVGAPEGKKRIFFIPFILSEGNIFKEIDHLCFISMNSVLNILSEYTYFYKSKNNTSYTFLLVFKIVERLQCILKLSKPSTVLQVS